MLGKCIIRNSHYFFIYDDALSTNVLTGNTIYTK